MRLEFDVDPTIGGKVRGSSSDDAAIAALADRQYGAVARRQLIALGIGPRAIEHRLAKGRLHPLYRGVYAVGDRALPPEAAWMAGLLAAGPGAVLSHRSAAVVWRIVRRDGVLVEATTPVARRRRSGLILHTADLAPDEVTLHRGLPVTTVPRTLLDIAAVLPRRRLERALDEAEVLRLGDALPLRHLVERHAGRRGVETLRGLLDDAVIGSTATRSELEDRFRALVDEAGLPRPRVNHTVQVRGRLFELDCAWPSQRIAVELDGHVFHGTRSAFERDRARDRMLQAAGWRVIRITWRQLAQQPQAVVSDLVSLLAPDTL
jgi:very-short-patch-repair endonuclease